MLYITFMARGLKILLFYTLLICSCSPARVIVPLEKGEQSISAAIGGPMLRGAPSPVVPLGSIAYARGFGKRISGSVGLNISALIFKTVYIDPSLHWASHPNLEKPLVPAFGLRGTAHTLLGLRQGDFLIYPEWSPYLFWERKKSRIYFGLENWIDPRASLVSEDDPKYLLFSLYSGWQWNKANWQFQIELKYNGINAPPNLEILDFAPVQFGSRGAFGIYFGVARRGLVATKRNNKYLK